MLESLFIKFAGPETFFHVNIAKNFKDSFSYRTAPVAWSDYSGLGSFMYQTRPAHPLSRRIASTFYEFS